MSRPLDLVIQGVLGTNPVLSHAGEDNRSYCRFRVATTPSYRGGDNQWHDAETLWFTAKAWGRLAENLAFSLHKGDPVLLSGRFSQEDWKNEQGAFTSNVLTLSSAGHDLSRGRSIFARVLTSEGAGVAGSAGSAPSAESPGAAAESDPLPGRVSEDAHEQGGGTQPSVVPSTASPVPTPEGALPDSYWESRGDDHLGHQVPDYVLVDVAEDPSRSVLEGSC